MGARTITGGMFSTDSYRTVREVDKLIPVDVYLTGCPPKNFVRKYLEKYMKIELGRNKRGVLLPITSFMLDAVLILEIMIKHGSLLLRWKE